MNQRTFLKKFIKEFADGVEELKYGSTVRRRTIIIRNSGESI